ncbi:MAG: PulJ/GspJ family protein [Fimbriiglobus sp.]
MLRQASPKRSAFTLVELLVAAALTVLIMAILATAFQQGMSTMSHLKSVVGLSEQLRSAENIIRTDFESQHLELDDGKPIRVSDPRLAGTVWRSPYRGYLQVIQGSVPVSSGGTFILEGTEDGNASYRATDHAVFLTSKRKASSKDEVFFAEAPNRPNPAVPPVIPPTPATDAQLNQAFLDQSLQEYEITGGQFVSEWAELGYYLVPSPVFTTAGDTGTTPLQLYTLHRAQRALSKTAAKLGTNTFTATQWQRNYPELSIASAPPAAPVFVNDSATITNYSNRFIGPWNPFANPTTTPTFTTYQTSTLSSVMPVSKLGTDILLSNVISMHVRMIFKPYPVTIKPDLTITGSEFVDELPKIYSLNPSATNPGYPRIFDTAANFPVITVGMNPPVTLPHPVPTAIQIKLRVYDTKNHMSRQMTITVDL